MTAAGARALCHAGYAHIERRRFDEAAAAFEEAARLVPEAEAPRLGLAHVRFAQGRLLAAKAILERALSQMPWSAALQVTLAEVHLARGRLSEARVSLDAARACPDDLAAHVLVEALEEALSSGALALSLTRKAG